MRDDLFEALRTPPPVDPIPASEVRRRGDRLRRRRTAFQVVGAAAVVAVVAGGALTLPDVLGDRSSSPPVIEKPETSETATAPRIRDDFPLAAGWPAASGDGSRTAPSRDVAPIEFYNCDLPRVIGGSGDRIGTTQSEGSAGYSRELHTFGTPGAAEAAMQGMQDKLTACTSWKDELGSTHRGELQSLHDYPGFGWAAWSEQVSAQSLIVVQEGNALLVSTASTEGHGAAMAREVLDTDLQQLKPVLTQLTCEYGGGCQAPEGEDGSHPSLADFPLTAGWPAEGNKVSMKDGPEPFTTCGVSLSELPESTGWDGVSLDGEASRQLFVFDTPETARTMLDTTQAKACRDMRAEADAVRTSETRRSTGQGGTDRLAVTNWFQRDGQGISGGVESIQLIRNGRAVLVSFTFGEGVGQAAADELAADDLAGMTAAIEALQGLA